MVAAAFGIAVLGCVALLLVLGLYNERAAERDWSEILSPSGQRAFRTLRQRFEAEEQATTYTYGRALRLRSQSSGEAVRLLAVGQDFLASTTPERLRLLKRLSVFSRMVSSMAPLPPIRPRGFRLPQLVTLAGMGAVAHYLLVAVVERFSLRLLILRHGFPLVLRALVRSRRRIETQRVDTEWNRVLAAHSDHRTLDHEMLESCRVLLVALGAEV
jgi:hypothetical protein